jgi:hypothetical protein
VSLRVLLLCGLGLLAGCHRTLRETKLEGNVDTGVVLDFGELDGRQLQWDFGDGSPRASARQAKHGFAKAGHYVVQGFDGELLVERVELTCVPRALPRAVPADAEVLIWAPSVKEDVGPVVDFFERIAGPAYVQRTLELSWLPALAVELSSGDASVIDPQEGVGLLMLPGFEGQISVLGVLDGDKALTALTIRLAAGGADEEPKTPDGLKVFSAAWGSAAAFVDRGYLYLVQPDVNVGAQDVGKVAQRIRASPALGLQANPEFTQTLTGIPNANLFVYAREDRPQGNAGRAPLLQSVLAGLSVGTHSATLEGRVKTARPLTHLGAPTAMFTRAMEGPVGALKLSFPPGELAGLAAGSADGRKAGLLMRLEAAGVDTDAALRAFTGEIGALAWFDAEGFLKNLVSGTGKPEWRGVVHLIAPVSAREPVEPVGKVLLGEPLRAPFADDRNALLWQQRLAVALVTVALTPKALMVRSGEGSGPRTNVNLEKELTERFHGAFGPGHSSLLFDLGRLKTELDQPRVIPGLDATKVVTVQGFSSAFLDQLTPIQTLVLDFAPDAQGGRLWGSLMLKAPVSKVELP